ncbi:MAG: chorismate mutase, partial [Thermoguttaceae bacterium]|nr:chorismate mutase [Thermoguttaceae bacterium]
MELNLPSLRREIDRLDNTILQTLQKRLEVARLVIKFKREQNQNVNVPERELQILNSLKGRERSLLS